MIMTIIKVMTRPLHNLAKINQLMMSYGNADVVEGGADDGDAADVMQRIINNSKLVLLKRASRKRTMTTKRMKVSQQKPKLVQDQIKHQVAVAAVNPWPRMAMMITLRQKIAD